MAIQSKTLPGAMHDWFATRSGLGNGATLTEHMANYFISKGFGGNASIHPPISQMESDWLGSLTGVTSQNYSDMWLEAVAGAGLTPGKSVDQNKFIFFTSIASGTNP